MILIGLLISGFQWFQLVFNFGGSGGFSCWVSGERKERVVELLERESDRMSVREREMRDIVYRFILFNCVVCIILMSCMLK